MTCGRGGLCGSGETHGSGGPFDSVGPSGTNFLAAVEQENDPPHPTTEIYDTKNLNIKPENYWSYFLETILHPMVYGRSVVRV